ncbi:poly-beta-1,6 N-acetyl-D-glucosamine export porin PgaA [Hydrogenophaga sp. BPS33]|uniref:poly-beta-1,6 N-acetyl-D-glucosamine export porin PgaA n=1 Tax=Hydrogenophaga sp. BPS33 TaxID=2651974 RepID=UPI001F30BA87|nr:poly-beta-1,6 N-acetyl-D-glucosamine export porin PgaA [Hydrogenophaga sp. BPS33]
MSEFISGGVSAIAGPLRQLPLCALILVASMAKANPASDYEGLLQRARAGDHGPFLAAVSQAARGERELNDYLAVAGWAGRQAALLRVYEEQAPTPLLRDYALIEVARAYRDAGRWDAALALFEDGARRFPGDGAFSRGAVTTLADASRLDEAERRARERIRQRADEPDAYLALAYVHERRGQPFAALAEADRAFQRAPSRKDVVLAYVDALSQARMAEPALRVARQHAQAVDAALMRRLENQAAAEMARMADLPSRGEAERFAVADRALERYEQLLAAWRAQVPRPDADIRRARTDRLAALHARVRMREVVEEYTALAAEGPVPTYALSDVAAAYLYLREPERARELYAQSLQANAAGGDEDARAEDEVGLTYALMESEVFGEASRVSGEALERQPIWYYAEGVQTRTPSDRRLTVERLAALERLYANDTRTAQAAFDGMVAKAPNNTGLLSAQAQVLRARELPRASERVLKMAETLEPRDRSVMTGQGFTALELQEWRQAQLLRDDMVQRFPEDLGVLRLDREWQVHLKAELQVNGYQGLKSNNPVTGSRDRGLEAVLYSRPMADHWRAFAGVGQASSRFEDGAVRYRWLRGGVQWRGRDLTVQGEVSANRYGSGTRSGAGLTVDYDLNDHWQIGVGLAHRSRETPLQALQSGIHANRVDTYVRWRADERREWRLGYSPSRFSDGNQRQELLLQGRERLYTQPRYWLDALVDVSASHNSRAGAPYFNPSADASLLPALRLTHILYRRYETVWEHHLTVGAGRYTQRGFGGGGVVQWEYGHRWRTHDVFEVGASIGGLSRPYDGQRERDLRIAFDLTYRF